MNLQHHFDYTKQSRRPTAAQIVSDWKKAKQPDSFSVQYGETEAEFQRYGGRWDDSGNGCGGVNRLAVVKALTAASGPAKKSNWLG